MLLNVFNNVHLHLCGIFGQLGCPSVNRAQLMLLGCYPLLVSKFLVILLMDSHRLGFLFNHLFH